MRESRKIYFSEISDALQQRMHYQHRDKAFRALWDAWVIKQKRLGLRTFGCLYGQYRRGYLRLDDAVAFCDYCITGWNPILDILAKRNHQNSASNH